MWEMWMPSMSPDMADPPGKIQTLFVSSVTNSKTHVDRQESLVIDCTEVYCKFKEHDD